MKMIKSNGNGSFEIRKWTFIVLLLVIIGGLLGTTITATRSYTNIENSVIKNIENISENREAFENINIKLSGITRQIDSLIIVLNQD